MAGQPHVHLLKRTTNRGSIEVPLRLMSIPIAPEELGDSPAVTGEAGDHCLRIGTAAVAQA